MVGARALMSRPCLSYNVWDMHSYYRSSMCGYYHSSGHICTEKLSLGPFLGFQKWYILEASTLQPHTGSQNPPSGNPGYGAKGPV